MIPMKRFLILTGLLLTLISASAAACPLCSDDNVRRHEVQRGETLGDIAARYGTTESELIRLNPDTAQLIYVGMEIIIPDKPTPKNSPTASSATSPKQSASNASAASGSLGGTLGKTNLPLAYTKGVENADDLLDKKKYRKADKAYTEIIKIYQSESNKCGEAYYGRALAAYNRSKWKSAIKDFESAINDRRLKYSSRKHCRELLAKARKYREEQLERRSEMWAGIMQATIGAAVSTAAVIESSKHQSSSSSNYSSGSYLSGSSGSYGSSSSSGGSSSSSSGSVDNSKKACPSLNANSGKWYCAGTGKCGMCNGDGMMNGSFGQGANSHKCTLCGGSGVCKYCGGSGHG